MVKAGFDWGWTSRCRFRGKRKALYLILWQAQRFVASAAFSEPRVQISLQGQLCSSFQDVLMCLLELSMCVLTYVCCHVCSNVWKFAHSPLFCYIYIFIIVWGVLPGWCWFLFPKALEKYCTRCIPKVHLLCVFFLCASLQPLRTKLWRSCWKRCWPSSWRLSYAWQRWRRCSSFQDGTRRLSRTNNLWQLFISLLLVADANSGFEGVVLCHRCWTELLGAERSARAH